MTHTSAPWVNGWGEGLTGPNTPSEPTVSYSLHHYDWQRNKRDYPKAVEYYIPISIGTDTIAIVVGPNRESDAKLIAAAPDLLAVCKAANLRLLQQKSVADDMELLDDLQAAIRKAEGK